MSDVVPPGGRPLAEVERQTFQRLSLTPGHWAALAPAPLFYRAGLRAPNRRGRADLEATERLRVSLRTAHGLSAEAGHFWDRLGDGSRAADAQLATRLLAWHLATDAPFARRVDYFQQLRHAADHFAARHTYPPRHSDAVQSFRALVDACLPQPNFAPDADPPRTVIPAPMPGLLDRLARTISSPPVNTWPRASPLDAAVLVPCLARYLGAQVGEWWGRGDPARRAVERGMASMPFEERWAAYMTIYAEWYRALSRSYPSPYRDDFAQAFVQRLREWVDAVRRAAREAPREEAREHFSPEPLPPLPAVPVAPLAAEAAPEPVPESAPAPTPEPHPEVFRVPASVGEPPPEKPPAPKPPEKPTPERVSVRVAEPFATVGFEQALARAASVSVAQVCAWVDSGPRLLFDDCRDESAPQVAVVRTENAVPPALWIVGDLHADLLTLANLVAFAESQAAPDRPAHFLFLGDFVDRGLHDHETLLALFELMMDHPGRVCVVPGNHDVDLQYDEAARRFRVTIEPAEYCESLNAPLARDAPEDRERVELARAFIRFCAGRPRAVFLPDGTLVAHGGFPHTDVQKEIAALADLGRPRAQDDFLWARIAESARVKRPNRGSRGHEFGWDTFAQFCKVAAERLEVPVRRLVRGHDHVPDRWQEYPEYADNGVPVLTVNAMGRLLDGEPARRDGRAHPMPALARFTPGHLPEVVLLPLDPAEVSRASDRSRDGGAADEVVSRVTPDGAGGAA